MFGTLFPGVQPARYGIVAALLCAAHAQAADWTLLRVPGIEVYTDASGRAARQTIDRLEQIRGLLGSPAKPDLIPLRVFLFAKTGEYLEFAPNAETAGFYQSGFERDYIVTSAGSPLDRVVAHEYVHFVANERDVIRPVWLEEGLADFYSTFDGKHLGAPVREHLRRLELSNWLSAAEMNSPRELTDIFYAQSWALVHMLRSRPPFPDRITSDMVTELRQYVRSMRATPVKVPTTAMAAPSSQPVSALEAVLLRADLAVRTGHGVLAHQLYAQAAREYPGSSSAATGVAMLALGDGDRDKASAELQRALALNDRDAQAWFQLAVMTNDDGALAKAVELDPSFGEARVLLGVHATDDGDIDAALEHLQQAARLMPRKSYVWYSLGYAQQKQGDPAAARRSLERALQTAATQEQRSMAATLLDSLL